MRVVIFGAGAIGATIAEMLAAAGGYRVAVADRDSAALARLRPRGLELRQVDVADRTCLLDAARGHDAVVSALPFFLNRAVAEAALAARAHYLDLTEDVATTRAVRRLADGAPRAFIPQCGLAPGFVGIAAYSLAQRFDRLRDVRMRVGALPRNPTNALKYNLTWSTDGLINEYCNPCEAIRRGRLVELAPLEGLERFSLDGVEYEAFNTSGGLGTLCETLAGKVETLDYKTIRYPGHRDIMKVLLDDLRLSERRQLLKDVLESAVPSTKQDVVLAFVAVSGWREGRLVEESFVRKIYGGEAPEAFSAIQAATAAGLCAMLELLRAGKIPQQGFVRQEEARLEDVLATRFGAVFAEGEVRSRSRIAA